MKKQIFFFACSLTAAFQICAQGNGQPTMGQLIGVNTVPGINDRFLRQFDNIREFHEWGLDIGFDEDETNCNPDPQSCQGGGPIPNSDANCPVQKRYGWNPSYNTSAITNYDELYSKYGGRYSPTLKSIAPEYRGLNNYPGFTNIYEEKPVCLTAAYTYNNQFPLQTSYPSFNTAQVQATTYTGYAQWATMFAARFGATSLGATDPLIQSFYLPRLLGGDPAKYNCDYCKRHIEPQVWGRGDIKYMEVWNEEDQTWTDGIPTAPTLDAAPMSFTRTYFYPHQYAALLSAAYDGHVGSLIAPGTTNSPLGIKNVDGGMKVVMGGTAGLRKDYVLGIMGWCVANRTGTNVAKLPFDVLNFHHYSSSSSQNLSDEQQKHNAIQFGGGEGIMPEPTIGSNNGDDLKGRLNSLIVAVKGDATMLGVSAELGNKEWWLSEFGYDSEIPQDGSGIKVPIIGTADREKVQAQWLTRSFLEISAAQNTGTYINKAMIHTLQDPKVPYTRQFDYSGLITSEDRAKRSWFYVLTLKYVLKGAKYQGEGFITNGGYTYSTNPANQPVKIYRYHDTEGDIYAIWSPTKSGNSFNMTINNPSLTATLIEIKEWDANGRRTQAVPNGTSMTIPVSETPVFLRIGQAVVDPIVQPVYNLTAQSLCCGSMQLNWTKNQAYRQYTIYYVKKSEVPTPSPTTGSFNDFYNEVWPKLTFFNIEIPGGATSAVITGLSEGEPYWFFVVPNDNIYNLPDFNVTIPGFHYIGGTPQGCGSSGYCIYNVTAGQIQYNQTNCNANWPSIQKMFGLSDTGTGCENVNNDAVNVKWSYAQNNNPVCNTVTIDFQNGGNMGQIIKALYVRTMGSEGRLAIEYELCGCPGFIKGPIITLPVVLGTVLTGYSNIFPQQAIKKVRFTRLEGAAIQRIFFCSKTAPCSPGIVGGPTPPTDLTVKDITSTGALLTWSQSIMDGGLSGVPAGTYDIAYSTSMVNNTLVNPSLRTANSDMELIEQSYRMRDLTPNTTYFVTVSTNFPCTATTTSSSTTSFTTPADNTGRSSDKVEQHLYLPNAQLSVVPNPNLGVFEVWLPSDGFEKIQVFDLSGKLLKSNNLLPNAKEVSMDLTHLPPGTYLLRAWGGKIGYLPAKLFIII